MFLEGLISMNVPSGSSGCRFSAMTHMGRISRLCSAPSSFSRVLAFFFLKHRNQIKNPAIIASAKVPPAAPPAIAATGSFSSVATDAVCDGDMVLDVDVADVVATFATVTEA